MALSVAMTLGVLGWLDRPLNLVTVILPPFVITLGLAYAMHVLEAYGEADGAGARERAAEALRAVGVAVAVTALTTAAGLAALGLHPLAAIREFGWLALLGIGFSGLLSLIMLPALLAVAGHSTRRIPPATEWFRRMGDRLASFALRRRREMLALGIALLVVALLSLLRLSVGTAYIENLPEDHIARLDFEAIDERFGSATGLLVAVETNHRDAILEPDLLESIEAFQEWLAEQPEVAGSTSIVDHLKVLHVGLLGADEGFTLPSNAELAKQLLIFGGGDALHDITDAGFRRTLIRVRAATPDTRELARLVTRIESRARDFPAGVSAAVTGESVLHAQTLSRIATGQVQSVFAALALIYVVLAALFSSLRVGLIALLPNALPIAFYFGALALVGIPLTPSTSLIACIALGIAVDDTIHYLVRFNAEARRTTREEEATRLALRAVIRPVTFTTLALCMGFLVFTGSELQNQVHFGALAAATLAFAWLVDVTLTPALCSGVRIVTLWDVLRLDLGTAPQSSISLFEGLSPRQTRLFALTADIQIFAAGEVVRREGEHARDMFVVLDGEVQVWTDRGGERVLLHRAARGDMVGEFSFFAERHGATVDAVQDARLLRFEDIDLELMMRRYPRAAARIYANLNKIQAARLVEASGRMESL
jgi:predicted RND superfamily exporter protein